VASRPQERARELRRVCEFLYGPSHTRRRVATAVGAAGDAAAVEAAAAAVAADDGGGSDGGGDDGGEQVAPRVENTPAAEVEARLRGVLELAAAGDRAVDTAYKPRVVRPRACVRLSAPPQSRGAQGPSPLAGADCGAGGGGGGQPRVALMFDYNNEHIKQASVATDVSHYTPDQQTYVRTN
jgi:hypothetical protein